MNVTIITGNVGAVKEPATVGTNNKVLNFHTAVNKYFKKDGETVTETVWYECALWNRESIFPFIKKGTKVTLQGEVGARAYIDKENKAVAVLTFEVVAIEFDNPREKGNE